MEPNLDSSYRFLQEDTFEIKGVKVKAKDWIENVHKIIEGTKHAVLEEGLEGKHEVVFVDSHALGNHKVLTISDIDDITRGLLKYAAAYDILQKHTKKTPPDALPKDSKTRLEEAHSIAIKKMESAAEAGGTDKTIADVAHQLWQQKTAEIEPGLKDFSKRVEQGSPCSQVNSKKI